MEDLDPIPRVHHRTPLSEAKALVAGFQRPMRPVLSESPPGQSLEVPGRIPKLGKPEHADAFFQVANVMLLALKTKPGDAACLVGQEHKASFS